MAKWNIAVPKCEKGTTSDEVLVTIEKASIITGEIYNRVVKAVYIPHHNCSLEDLGWNVDDEVGVYRRRYFLVDPTGLV